MLDDYGNGLKPGQKAAQTKAYNKFKESLKEARKDILEWHNQIRDMHNDLLIDKGERKSKNTEIGTLISELEKRKSTIEDTEEELNKIKLKIIGGGENDGIVNEINSLLESIRSKSDYFDDNTKRLEVVIKKIDGDSDEEGNVISEGYLEKIKSLDEAYNKSLKKYDLEGKELLAQIKGILESATNVELARGFEIQKRKARWSKWSWGFGFTVAIGLMVSLGAWFYLNPGKLGGLATVVFNAVDAKQNKLSAGTITFIWLINLLQKLVIFVPLIWFALKCSKNQSQAARFEAEYAHKESVAITYNGHKSQLSDVAGKEADKLKELLAENLIETVSFNPSSTLEKDYHQQEDSIISRITSRVSRKKSGQKPNDSA